MRSFATAKSAVILTATALATSGSVPTTSLIDDYSSIPVYPQVGPLYGTMPPKVDLATVVGRTEAALLDQLSCIERPKAAKAIRAMLKNKLIKETAFGTEEYAIYEPTRPLTVLGFPVVHLTGWQATASGRPMPPFSRGVGMMPLPFLDVSVRGDPDAIRVRMAATGLQEDIRGPNLAAVPMIVNGKRFTLRRREHGMSIEPGDIWPAESRYRPVTTLSCISFGPVLT